MSQGLAGPNDGKSPVIVVKADGREVAGLLPAFCELKPHVLQQKVPDDLRYKDAETGQFLAQPGDFDSFMKIADRVREKTHCDSCGMLCWGCAGGCGTGIGGSIGNHLEKSG